MYILFYAFITIYMLTKFMETNAYVLLGLRIEQSMPTATYIYICIYMPKATSTCILMKV
jgi:hypothetical protein